MHNITPSFLRYGKCGPLVRLENVAGFQARSNDVVYCPPLLKPGENEEPTVVVYFGGDVQDFSELMELNRDSKRYLKYNLESTALILQEGFPSSHIVVVRPTRCEFKTFSCFDNFVPGNNAGVPDHTPMHHSLLHLEKLLINVCQRLKSKTESEIQTCIDKTIAFVANLTGEPASNNELNTNGEDMDIDILKENDTINDNDENSYEDKDSERNTSAASKLSNEVRKNNIQQTEKCFAEPNDSWWRDYINIDKAKLSLIGFSKGCVVLNQFIYEFHFLKTLTPDDSSMLRLLSRITDMYWLDGGHGGTKNTWITSRSLLETLTRLGIKIHVHVTPYQVQDDRRPWIRKEEKIFTDMLRRLGAPLTRSLHFDPLLSNLFTHFDVIQVFWQPCQQPADS